MKIEIKPLTKDEVSLTEKYFTRNKPNQHKERLEKQEDGKAVYLFAWIENNPVGHVFVKWQGSSDEAVFSKMKDCPDLEDLFVLSEHRNKGIGSQLLNNAEKLAKEKGFSKTGLGVEINDIKTKSLYEKRGYKDSDIGNFTIGDTFLGKDGKKQSWQETCVYLVKELN